MRAVGNFVFTGDGSMAGGAATCEAPPRLGGMAPGSSAGGGGGGGAAAVPGTEEEEKGAAEVAGVDGVMGLPCP